jgi:hypothetical protein
LFYLLLIVAGFNTTNINQKNKGIGLDYVNNGYIQQYSLCDSSIDIQHNTWKYSAAGI